MVRRGLSRRLNHWWSVDGRRISSGCIPSGTAGRRGMVEHVVVQRWVVHLMLMLLLLLLGLLRSGGVGGRR